MIQKNQLVVISGILVLLATTMAAVSYNIQTAKALSTGSDNFGTLQASKQATDGGTPSAV